MNDNHHSCGGHSAAFSKLQYSKTTAGGKRLGRRALKETGVGLTESRICHSLASEHGAVPQPARLSFLFDSSWRWLHLPRRAVVVLNQAVHVELNITSGTESSPHENDTYRHHFPKS